MPSESPPAKPNRPAPLGAVGFVRRAVGLLRPYTVAAVALLLGLVLEMAFNGAVPMVFRALIDKVLAPHDKSLLAPLLIGLGGGVVVVALVGVRRDFGYSQLQTKVVNDLRLRIFEHLQALSMEYYSRAEVGDVLSRFSSDLASVETALQAAIPWGLLPALDVAMSTVLLFLLDWKLALVAMLIWPFAIAGPRYLAPRASVASLDRKEMEASLLSTVQENVMAQAIVKAYGLQGRQLDTFRERLALLGAKSARVGFLSALIERSAGVGVLLLQVIIIGAGGLLAWRGPENGGISIGTLVSFQALFAGLSASLTYVVQYVPQLISASGALHHIELLLAEKPRVFDRPGAKALDRFAKDIEFRNVVFGYQVNKMNLDLLSFRLKAGEKVAFVGPSGSGKSTVLQLVARFYDPDIGMVLVDGKDLKTTTQDSWRSQVGFVFQESFLFNTTVRENIRVSRPTASDAEIEAAARAAEIHDIIVKMPQGYDTMVGERGGRLSGGQRQRIAIARALLRNPSVLVLDEATSALDAGTESAINETLKRASAGRTVLEVTHRLASAVEADRIIVLDSGHLAEQGKHEELLAKNGLYKQLWEKQSGFAISADGRRAQIDAARLRAVPLLSLVDEEHLNRIARMLVTEERGPNEVVFRQDDPGDKFYIIVRGSVNVSARDPQGIDRRLRVMEAGDAFGEIALMEHVPRTATITTRGPSLFLTLTRDAFGELLKEQPQLYEAMRKAKEERLERSRAQAQGARFTHVLGGSN